MDPEPFERLAIGEEQLVEMTVEHDSYDLVLYELLYALPECRQYVGIFVNLTDWKVTQDQLEEMRDETTRKARELLDHQIRMAQGLSRYIGENTARTEELVQSLLNLAMDRQG